MTNMKTVDTVFVILMACLAQAFGQDATALEEQYKTCARHSIPSDKCTAEIFRQLKEKDSAPLDPKTDTALKAAKLYQKQLKNPSSMQVQTAYVTDAGEVCLEIGAQSGFGGIAVNRVVYDPVHQTWISPKVSFGDAMASAADAYYGIPNIDDPQSDIWISNLGHCFATSKQVKEMVRANQIPKKHRSPILLPGMT